MQDDQPNIEEIIVSTCALWPLEDDAAHGRMAFHAAIHTQSLDVEKVFTGPKAAQMCEGFRVIYYAIWGHLASRPLAVQLGAVLINAAAVSRWEEVRDTRDGHFVRFFRQTEEGEEVWFFDVAYPEPPNTLRADLATFAQAVEVLQTAQPSPLQ